LSALKKKSTNHKKRSIGIVIAAAMMLLLLAGTILAPTQASAISQHSKSGPQFNNFNDNTNDNTNTANSRSTSGGFTDTASLKHAIRDGVTVNLQHRDQHMNQENLCYRTNTCRQSDVGQNTLGNDNSVTGFGDQSDNLKQSAAPTTANQTTPTPTPTPTPTTATLTVTKIVPGNTTAIPAQFAIHVTGNNPDPPNFAGSTTGIDVTLGSGAFNVTETPPTGSFFTSSFIGDCAGTVAAGQHLSCTIVNTPKTCVECFTSLLTTTQLNLFEDIHALASLCLAPVTLSEFGLRINLTTAGVSVATQNELIACLIAAGVVFT
jgi:hypothetical protein